MFLRFEDPRCSKCYWHRHELVHSISSSPPLSVHLCVCLCPSVCLSAYFFARDCLSIRSFIQSKLSFSVYSNIERDILLQFHVAPLLLLILALALSLFTPLSPSLSLSLYLSLTLSLSISPARFLNSSLYLFLSLSPSACLSLPAPQSLSLHFSLSPFICLCLPSFLFFFRTGATAISKSIFLEIAKKQGPSDFIYLVAAVDHAVLLKRMIDIRTSTVTFSLYIFPFLFFFLFFFFLCLFFFSSTSSVCLSDCLSICVPYCL